MEISITNIILAFFEGVALIISPCILPILPIILSSSLTGSKIKPYGIILGFILSFSLFTFFARALVRISGIDLNVVRNVSLIFLLLFGLILISTYLSEKFTLYTQRLANVGASTRTDYSKSDFINGLVFGGLIGIVWTPCAGPILAAVIVQTVLQENNLSGFFTVLSFGLGAGIPMLLIAFFGRQIIMRFQFLRERTNLIRKILGGIIILSVVYIFYDPNLSALTTSSNQQKSTPATAIINGLYNSYSAPPIEDITEWINTNPITLNQLRGQVVLIDYWAYSCINCIRTLPYLKDWYKKYHEKGFTIIGVHSPEFDFEKVPDNVKAAVKKYGILYPVALDNHFTTWRNYHNQYWPAHYLIDKSGQVVYTHFGEGEYDITENNIRFLLNMNEPVGKSIEAETLSGYQTPETYLGYARAENYYSPQTIIKNQAGEYSYPSTLPEDGWALKGEWKIEGEKIISTEANASLKIRFHGKKVFAVMGTSSTQPIQVKLLLNGEPLIQYKGMDVTNSTIHVKNHDLYRLIEFKYTNGGIIELIITAPGVEIYTFTFG